MADNHIDYREVSEYGRYFLKAVAELESSTNAAISERLAAEAARRPLGLTVGLPVGLPDSLPESSVDSSSESSIDSSIPGSLIDISMIRGIVEEAVLAVEASLPTADSDPLPHAPRKSVQSAMRDCRDRVQRFYYYLRSLPPEAAGDLLAFFPSGRLGALDRLGAAELASKMEAIERGFSAPGNLGLSNALVWREELEVGRDALTQALAQQRVPAVTATASGSLARARAYFLRVYHGLAKPAVRALLTYLGRDHEYRHFFLDLQAGERRFALAA